MHKKAYFGAACGWAQQRYIACEISLTKRQREGTKNKHDLRLNARYPCAAATRSCSRRLVLFHFECAHVVGNTHATTTTTMTVKKKTAAWNLYQISFRYLFSDYVAHSQLCSFFFYLFSTVQCTRVFVPNFLPIYIRFVCMVYASIYISICDIHRTPRKICLHITIILLYYIPLLPVFSTRLLVSPSSFIYYYYFSF